jgi:hypothetical protein
MKAATADPAFVVSASLMAVIMTVDEVGSNEGAV